jgi:hypothetical protein
VTNGVREGSRAKEYGEADARGTCYQGGDPALAGERRSQRGIFPLLGIPDRQVPGGGGSENLPRRVANPPAVGTVRPDGSHGCRGVRNGRIVNRPAIVLAAGLSALATACTERAVLEVDSETAPGQATPTTEIEIPVQGMISWRDTTYSGYALPSSSSYRLLTDSNEFQSRLLARFESIPDSIYVGTAIGQPIESYANGRFRLIVDTATSLIPQSGLELEVFALTRDYEERYATWSSAADDEPWTEPGGDLGERLGSLRIDAPFDSTASDTLFIPFEVSTDSLLSSWATSDGEPGLAIRTTGAGSSVDVRSLVVSFEVKPVGQDSLIPTARLPGGYTVIFDPETPRPGQESRIGGLPASRIYVDFELPETWDGLQLKGSTINTASLVFRPLAPPPIPFRLEDPVEVVSYQLLADPFEVGPKTPIGRLLGPLVLLDPDELVEDDAELQLSITPLVLIWSFAPEDSLQVLRIGVQVSPEGRDLGFWEFGSAEDMESLRPSVRMIVTPRVPFRLP